MAVHCYGGYYDMDVPSISIIYVGPSTETSLYNLYIDDSIYVET